MVAESATIATVSCQALGERATIHFCYHSPPMVAESATIATVSCQALGSVLPFIFATIRWMVATVADFATVYSKSGSQLKGLVS